MKIFKPLAFLLVPLLVVVGVLSQRQAIFDWYKLRDYAPSAEVVSLSVATTMTDKGTHIFYVYHPELNDRVTFNQNCTESEESIVLGCYVQNQGIYLYDVDDDRLQGIEEVTAAHEMLHAAYDRLSVNERKKVDALTSQVFLGLSDGRIKKTIEAYRAKDPSVVPNELHSIIGSEVRDIPQELEDYYRQYFKDRSVVVGYSERYESEFSKREQQATAYKAQLDSLRAEVDALNEQLSNQAATLTKEYAQLQSERSSAEPATFNAKVRAYNTKVAGYNQSVNVVSIKIDQYNQLVEQYNTVVVEENELIKAIDSRPSTIDTQ